MADTIRVDVGVYTALQVDCSDIDFTGIEKLILTIKNSPSVKSAVIIEKIFTEAKVYDVTILPEESLKLGSCPVYDIDEVTSDGKQYKMTENGTVIMRHGVGDCIE